ncbi:transglutaminase family protein [Hyphobacterium sp.]|uniref:transglutaminase family protein n=1 Tax=Hyphobacterium sp. TaxID=2004662 RepID=UPI0037492E4D
MGLGFAFTPERMHFVKISVLYLAICVQVPFCSDAIAQQPWLPSETAAEIREIIASVDDETDLTAIKLRLDQIVDPAINVEAGIATIERMASEVRAMAGPNPSNVHLLVTLRQYLYDEGAWNGFQPFAYDHNDPLGEHLPNKLLPNYLETREGNCVTMPFLMILIADRLGLDVTASTAPVHVFIRYTDDQSGRTINIEATSGGHPARDEWYRENMPITDLAVENGVYLATLSRQETVAVMATVVMEHFIEEGRYEEAIAVGDVILQFYPNYAYVLAKIGTAFYYLLEREFHSQYPTPAEIPVERRDYYMFLASNNHRAFETAYALGWQPEGGLSGEESPPE